MNLLMGLIFAKALSGKKVKSKQVSRRIKKETKFWIELITELMQLTKIIFKFIFVGISNIYKKCVCLNETVEEEALPENVIRLDEYKLKKVK